MELLAALACLIRCVRDGSELLDYLFHRGIYANADEAPKPGLILLDLNMPKKDGREVLAEIKADVHLRSIPVVVLTTSKAEEDIARTWGRPSREPLFQAICDAGPFGLGS